MSDSRKEFEAWFEGDALPLEHSDWFKREGDCYELSFVEHAWNGWKSRDAEIERLNEGWSKANSLALDLRLENVALEGEIERLKGLQPELPPFPPGGHGLPRYGLRWNGPDGPIEPLSVPMDDGYWTPYHLAASAQLWWERAREELIFMRGMYPKGHILDAVDDDEQSGKRRVPIESKMTIADLRRIDALLKVLPQ